MTDMPSSSSSNNQFHQPSLDRHHSSQKRRRTKKDCNANRDFKCPCGKTYLSYPALYTHIKQKHNGVAPGEVTKPNNNQSNNNNTSSDDETSSTSTTQFEDLLQILPAHHENDALPDDKPFTHHDLYALVDWEIQLEFMLNYTHGQPVTIPPYYSLLFKLCLDDTQHNILTNFDPHLQLYLIPSNLAFIHFIRSHHAHLTLHQIKHVLLFVYLFRKMINALDHAQEGGAPALTTANINNHNNDGNNNVEENAQTSDSRELSELANSFVTHHLIPYLSIVSNGLPQTHPMQHILKSHNIIQIMNHLTIYYCNWLYQQQLSNHKLKLNTV